MHRGTVGRQCLDVGGRGVALVLRPEVDRELLVQLPHQGVASRLREDRGGGDTGALHVGLDQRGDRRDHHPETDQVGQLLSATRRFAEAYTAGDDATARALYAPTRVHWERVEPVAESFGDLDPILDAREADLEEGQDWTGWHRIEKDLWPPASGYTALTDGVSRAWVADLVPPDLRGTALGVHAAVSGAGLLVAGLWAGVAWGASGRLPLVVSGAVTAVLAVALAGSRSLAPEP